MFSWAQHADALLNVMGTVCTSGMWFEVCIHACPYASMYVCMDVWMCACEFVCMQAKSQGNVVA